MAKKLQKVKDKKQMSPKTRAIIANSFKGVISNQSCIDNGKEAPWWLAIIFALVSIIIPLIPNHVRMANSYGSSFLSSGNYGLDNGLAISSVALKNQNKDLVIGEDQHLHYYNGDSDVVPTLEESKVPLFTYTRTPLDAEPTVKQTSFNLYYTRAENAALQSFVNELDAKKILKGTVDTIYNPEDESHKEKGYYTPNFMVLTYHTLAVAIYKDNSSNRAGNSYGGLNWAHMPKGSIIKDVLTYFDGQEGRVLPAAGQEVKVLADVEAVESVYKHWKQVFDNTYLDQKNVSKWNTTLIYLGVYAGLLVFLGLMVFLLTRGKQNPFRELNFWICQKISYFLAFTPSLLAMVLGFIIGANMIGQMAFIMLISLRVMWASMRQLRPYQQ